MPDDAEAVPSVPAKTIPTIVASDADGQHGLPEGEDGGQERHGREQPDEVGPGAVGELHGRHDREQHEGRAETGAGSWAERADGPAGE